jgi:hypothetical protein
MSDNTTLPTGSGGDTIRTIDRTTSKTQVIALDYGGEVGPESLVTANYPLPVLDPQFSDQAAFQRMQIALLQIIAMQLSHVTGVQINPQDILTDSVLQ